MKIVVLDGYTLNPGDISWDGMRQYGDLTVYDRTDVSSEDEITERIGDAEIVFTNKTPLSGKVFAGCPGLKFVGSWPLATMWWISRRQKRKES